MIWLIKKRTKLKVINLLIQRGTRESFQYSRYKEDAQDKHKGKLHYLNQHLSDTPSIEFRILPSHHNYLHLHQFFRYVFLSFTMSC